MVGGGKDREEMRIYISGAITNCQNYMQKFVNVERYLLENYSDCEVINPAMINSFLPKSTTHDEYMKMSFTMIDMADAIFMLADWRSSCGASQEYGYALAKDKIILYEETDNACIDELLKGEEG